FFGMRYVVPTVVDWPGTIIAVNVGGALIPVLLSLYILIKHAPWLGALVATACVTLVCYALATPVPGIGIAVPTLIPPLTAGAPAHLFFCGHPPARAYISGKGGALIRADLLNLGRVAGLGAPVVSIGGAGTFDGIFLTGIIALLFASIGGRR